MIQVGGEGKEEILGFGFHLGDARVRAIHLINNNNDGQRGFQGLAQHETSLRKRALGGVHEQNNAVHHGQAAFDFPAEIGVAGGIDHVNGDALRCAGCGRGRPAVMDRGVLREDGDAFFAFQFSGIHDALPGFLHGGALPESPGLPHERVHESGFPVINMRHNGNVAKIVATIHNLLPCRPAPAL